MSGEVTLGELGRLILAMDEKLDHHHAEERERYLDHEQRLRRLERFMYGLIGTSGLTAGTAITALIQAIRS
jgi:hypothetical protein